MGLVIIVALIYFIGATLYCILNAHRVGRFEDDKRTAAEDIVFESSFWPIYGAIQVILLPFKGLYNLTIWLHYKRHGNKCK